MKRVAIITITNSGTNFGNRVQNYALQTVLERYCPCVETIYSAKSVGGSLLLSRVRRWLKRHVKASARCRSFHRFDKRYIKAAPFIRYEHLNDHLFADLYDAFIVGSDQVWNPTFEFNTDFEYAAFADPSKRYSYSASFGISEIPEKDRPRCAAGLKEMREISVREEQGAKIVKELTGRDAMVHVDPTILLTAARYGEIEEKPELPIPEKYFLIYFLGEKTEEYQAFIRRIAGELSLPVLELSELPSTQYYNIGPQHFLYLFHHAEYVCTDSFHGVLFSILFHRPFTAFYRRNQDVSMNSRVQTILQKMDLEDRLFGSSSVEHHLEPINFAHVEECLALEREKATRYFDTISKQWQSSADHQKG